MTEPEVSWNNMAGITNYYHGESGFVLDCGYDAYEQQAVYVLHVQGDPHHEFAYAYGGDIHIDPRLETGDRAVYVRTDRYGGVWVRERDQYYPELKRAIDRVIEEQRGWYLDQEGWHPTERYISDKTRRKMGKDPGEVPATEASFFLSFSSKSVMLARQIFEVPKHDAKLEVWFDLDQGGESPEHTKRIERWLKEAVYNSRGFILLWTKAASASRWVRKEIAWAAQKASIDPEFHFVVLKFDEEPIPDELLDVRYIVDCHDLWPMHGVKEELFAAVAGRRGRVAWIEEHRRRGVAIGNEEWSSIADPQHGYEPFRSDSGVAISLRHWEEDGEFCWRLDYEKDRRLHKVFGRGRDQVVDLGIRTGDDVGFFIYNYTPLWMRSGDLRLTPPSVMTAYRQKVAS